MKNWQCHYSFHNILRHTFSPFFATPEGVKWNTDYSNKPYLIITISASLTSAEGLTGDEAGTDGEPAQQTTNNKSGSNKIIVGEHIKWKVVSTITLQAQVNILKENLSFAKDCDIFCQRLWHFLPKKFLVNLLLNLHIFGNI